MTLSYLLISPCDGASFIDSRNFQPSYGDIVVDFDLDLDFDMDSFFDRALLDNWCLVQVQVEVQVQVCSKWRLVDLSSFTDEVSVINERRPVARAD
jgi:hypothetical protein